MVPFASVFNTAFEKVVLLVTYVVFPIASWRELHGKKTGKKVLLNRPPQKTIQRNKKGKKPL